MKKKFWTLVVMLFLSAFLVVCNNTSSTKTEGNFELLTTVNLGCVEDELLEKPAQEGTLQWGYNEGVLKLFVDVHTHCAADFINTVTFTGNTVTIMLEDVADGMAKCTCTMREEVDIMVSGTTEVRVICKVKYQTADYFEKIIDRNLKLFF